MEKRKESKTNWALPGVDSEEVPTSFKISGKTEANEGLRVGSKKANVLYVLLVTFRLSKVLNTTPRCFIYEVFILNIFLLALMLSDQSNHHVTLEALPLHPSPAFTSNSA